MLVGNDVVAGTMLLRLCMLPGLALLIWAAPRVARHVGANGAAALWICVLNPLVIIHLMGGVHNEMLMVGLMMAGIALTFGGHHVGGVSLIAVAVAVKATAGLALPFMVWVWTRHLRDRRGYPPVKAFAVATAASALIFVAVFAVLSWLAGVGLGWLTALAGSVKIINWLTVPTAAANLINVFGSLFLPVNFYAVLDVTRIIGIAIIAISLPLLWWRFRHTDREALIGIALVMGVVVLFVPAALPWYYTWPLAVVAALAQSRQAIAVIAGLSTWITVIWKPDGAHGMYSWPHVLLATACAAGRGTRSTKRLRLVRHDRERSIRHRLGPTHHLTGLMRVQRINRPGISLLFGRAVAADGQRRVGREQPAHDLGVAVAAVVQHHEQPGQALHHVPGVVEEGLRHHHRAVATHRDQVPFPQLLVHLRHGNAEQIGNGGQVVDGLAGIKNVVGGRNAAHRTESKTKAVGS